MEEHLLTKDMWYDVMLARRKRGRGINYRRCVIRFIGEGSGHNCKLKGMEVFNCCLY